MHPRPDVPTPAAPIAVLEVGGTHGSSRWVGVDWQAQPESARVHLRGDAPAGQILDALARCVDALGELAGHRLAVAMPGPFDYAAGIGRFRDVGKYESLDGVDVRGGIGQRLHSRPAGMAFVNDAQAFGLGEWLAGEGHGRSRIMGITLGTGVGSAFVADGTPVDTGDSVPPTGELHMTRIDGRPLEEVVSRRAMLARYRAAGGPESDDVAQIAGRAVAGDARALDAFAGPLRLLGAALAHWARRFGAEQIVVGGAMSRSWGLVEPALTAGLADGGMRLPVARSSDPDRSAALGAAWHAHKIFAGNHPNPAPAT